MPFPESVKKEAKQRGNYRCVVCFALWVEVHHIVPESEGGPDTLENAAPLCASCHQQFGDNPMLRKQLREMRDWWWKRCEESRAAPDITQLSEKIDQLRSEFVSDERRQGQVLGEMKRLLIQHLRNAESAITSATTIGEVLVTSSAYSTGLPPSASYRCFHCGRTYPFPQARCSQCGAYLE